MKRYLLGIFVALTMSGFSQSEDSKVQPPLFGLGLNLTQFQYSDLYSYELYGAPANNLMLTVSPLKALRIEPEFGYMSFKRETTDGNGQKHDLRNKISAFGVGVFGMMQRGKTNLYGGVRYEMAAITSEWLDVEYDWTFGTASYFIREDKSTRSTISPTVGAEYFLGDHFSIGGEFSFRIMSITTKYYGGPTEKESQTATGAGLQMRFYL